MHSARIRSRTTKPTGHSCRRNSKLGTLTFCHPRLYADYANETEASHRTRKEHDVLYRTLRTGITQALATGTVPYRYRLAYSSYSILSNLQQPVLDIAQAE